MKRADKNVGLKSQLTSFKKIRVVEIIFCLEKTDFDLNQISIPVSASSDFEINFRGKKSFGPENDSTLFPVYLNSTKF